MPIDGMRCERLPHMKDLVQQEPLIGCYKHMNMIGHDDPLIKPVTLPVERLDPPDNDLDTGRIGQQTRTLAFIQPPFDTGGEQHVIFMPLSRSVGFRMRLAPYLPFSTQFYSPCSGYRIGQTERNEIYSPHLVPVRQMTPIDSLPPLWIVELDLVVYHE